MGGLDAIAQTFESALEHIFDGLRSTRQMEQAIIFIALSFGREPLDGNG